jgi:L,D-transpeptidase-like protein
MMDPRRWSAMGECEVRTMERSYQGIQARLRTPHRAVQRGPATQRFIVKGTLTAGVAVLALAGCGGTAAAHESTAPLREANVAADLGPQGRSCAAGSYRPLGSNRVAYAVVVKHEAWAHRRPDGIRFRHFGRLNANHVPTVFGVRGAIVDHRCRPRWYRVQLPLRPNGIVGYVLARDVGVAKINTRIVIDVSDRRLALFRKGRKLLESTVAVGSSATPTPIGSFYVNQRLVPSNPYGPFGPGAVGISAFSPVLTGWTQGGPIAIHGTNRPSSIGKAISNGCIRLPNSVLRRVFRAAWTGTPVVVRP